MADYELSRDALAALFRTRGDELVAWFARQTWDRHAAVDMTAEAFARAVQHRDRFDGSSASDAAGWLYGIAGNVLRSYLRRGRIEQSALQRLGIQRPEPTEKDLERIAHDAELEALRDALSAHLAALPADQRRAVRLRVIQELPYEVIAERTGASPDVVRARVSRGLRALRRAIEREPIEDLV